MRCMQRGTLRPHTSARAAEADSKEDGTGVAATSARTAPTQHAARHTRQLTHRRQHAALGLAPLHAAHTPASSPEPRPATDCGVAAGSLTTVNGPDRAGL